MTIVDTGQWTVDTVQASHHLELEPEQVVGREEQCGVPTGGGGQPALHYCTTALLHYYTASTDGRHYSAPLLQRESRLLGTGFEDFGLLLMYIDTQAVVREFPSHCAALTDIAFSADIRWLVC